MKTRIGRIGNIGKKAPLIMLLVSASLGGRVYAAPDLSGTYRGDDGAVYYLQSSGNVLWWAGLSIDAGFSPYEVWHRGLSFTTVFRGTLPGDNTVVGEWAHVTRGTILHTGTLTLQIETNSTPGEQQLTVVTATGGFSATVLSQIAPVDDMKIKEANIVGFDISSRFDLVTKNDDTTIHDNLKPYRDATVFYGRVVNTAPSGHDVADGELGVKSQAPHVNYGPTNAIPEFRDFGRTNRDFETFACFNPPHGILNEHDGTKDGDFDLRLKIDLDKLEPDFYTTGWGNRSAGPKVFQLKFNDATTRSNLHFAASEAFMGAEAIMYGNTETCDSHQGGTSLLPGWADLYGNSVLINGRPINGSLPSSQPSDTCDLIDHCPCYFIQPCPYLAGVTSNNYLVVPAGIQLGNLLIASYGDGKVPPGDGIGTYMRITGTLVLDCGHASFSDDIWLDHECNDDPDNPDEVAASQDQEIHPIYSIDIINYPFRPEDITNSARLYLTGAWGGSDGSTYYVRQIGNTIWWLGMMRDRQPIQRGTDFPIIGGKQLEPAFAADDPPCTSSSTQCWAFATVFKGTITESPIQTVIDGDWAGVPQSTSLGSSGGHMQFYVYNRKIIIPATPSIFPVTIEKMYEPEDTTPPVITILEPVMQIYAHSETITLNYGVSDGTGSGVQSVTPKMDDRLTLDDGSALTSGRDINLLTQMKVGQHKFYVSAVDNAGNESSNSVTFAIVVTAASIQDDVNQFVAAGKITKNEGKSLLTKLASAAKARAKGNCPNAATIYTSFISEVLAQSGKSIDPAAATILIADAQYLIDHCP
jgi:hypothetical protein